MAEWKKVIVSGSNISQLNNDAGYLVSGDLTAPNNSTITLTAGAGLAAIGDGSFTLNQASGETFTFGVDGVLEDLDSLGAPTSDGQFIVATGAGAFQYESGDTARTSLGGTAVGKAVFTGSSAAAIRSTLGVDAAGTDNSTNVTLAGSYDYITITGQTITRNQVDASTDISNLTTANVSEVTNLYYTDARVKTKLNTEGVISSSAQVQAGSITGDITLGTQTSGNYVGTITAGTGVSTTGASTGEGIAHTISIGQSVATSASPTFANLTLTGDLTVQGTRTELQVTNLNVEDQFILLNSGSVAADAGFVVNGQGAAFGWDESANRFALDHSGATYNQTALASDAFVAAVVTTDDANYRYNGNIRITAGEIYIYTE